MQNLSFFHLSASERSERDTYRGKNEKNGDVCWERACLVQFL